MIYVERPPSIPLRDYVEVLWHLRDEPDEPSHGVTEQLVVPDGRSELIFHFGSDVTELTPTGPRRQARAILAGQIDRPCTFRPEGEVDVVGVRFRPLGQFSLLGLPGATLTNTLTDATSCFDAASTWHDQLTNAPGDQRLSLLDALLLARLEGWSRQRSPMNRTPYLATAVASIEHDPTISILTLARSLDVTPRQLQRTMRHAVGIGPKTFARVRRFHGVVQRLDLTPRGQLALLAADLGYADQPHLNRDFRQFAGKSPIEYVIANTPWSDQFTDTVPRGAEPDAIPTPRA